jgi:hypothetical protein
MRRWLNMIAAGQPVLLDRFLPIDAAAAQRSSR